MNQVIQFVQTVERYPCIYNSDLPEYARKDTTERAWQEVSEKIHWTVQDCKDKWKNLRNGFVRSLKLGDKGELKKPYYLYDTMQFVIPYINKGISINKRVIITPKKEPEEEIEAEEHEEQVSEDEEHTEEDVNQEVEIQIDAVETRPLRQRRLKRGMGQDLDRAFSNYLHKRPRPLDDPKKMFLLSLLPDVKSLTDRQLGVFRIKVLMLLEDVKSRSGSELRELLGK